MYWLYIHKGFPDEKRLSIFVRKANKHYDKYLKRYFCQSGLSLSYNKIAYLFRFADNLSISYDEFWNKAFFGYIYQTGCSINNIEKEICSVQLRLYIQDSNLKPIYSVKRWFTALGYVNHKAQNEYYLWLIKSLLNDIHKEDKIKKLIQAGILPELYVKNLINRGV